MVFQLVFAIMFWESNFIKKLEKDSEEDDQNAQHLEDAHVVPEIQYADGYRYDLASGDDEGDHMLAESRDEPVDEYLTDGASHRECQDV